jgi:hypothetical protein
VKAPVAGWFVDPPVGEMDADEVNDPAEVNDPVATVADAVGAEAVALDPPVEVDVVVAREVDPAPGVEPPLEVEVATLGAGELPLAPVDDDAATEVDPVAGVEAPVELEVGVEALTVGDVVDVVVEADAEVAEVAVPTGVEAETELETWPEVESIVDTLVSTVAVTELPIGRVVETEVVTPIGSSEWAAEANRPPRLNATMSPITARIRLPSQATGRSLNVQLAYTHASARQNHGFAKSRSKPGPGSLAGISRVLVLRR